MHLTNGRNRVAPETYFFNLNKALGNVQNLYQTVEYILLYLNRKRT
jgi:hypothetical protein